jgi:hypothetical protein
MGQPHKCPLCLGSGCASQEIQKAQVEATGRSSSVCRGCDGKGLVFGDETPNESAFDMVKNLLPLLKEPEAPDFGPPYDQR